MSLHYTTNGYGEIATPRAESWPSYALALPYVLGDGRVWEMAEELAGYIIADVRTVEGPVVWLTGNAYMPPLRSFPIADRVWNAMNNRDGELFAYFAEVLEEKLTEAHVYMGCPDYDNSLWACDLKRWAFREDADDAENLEDMFERRAE
jgi:hypothetical protein